MKLLWLCQFCGEGQLPSSNRYTKNTDMTRKLIIVALAFILSAPPLPALAQFGAVESCDTCVPCVQEYRLVTQTIYEEKPVTTRRLQTETIVEEREVVRFRPVWETTTRERRYTVNKPVVQTSMREERKTVMKPVYEVRYRDASYDRTRMVAQTSSRTERRVVTKPVYETTMKREQRVVQKPVTTTVMQDQTATAYKPVTTYYQRTVENGRYSDQVQYEPGDVRHRLRWQGAECKPNPLTGKCEVQRPGLYWQPKQGPGKYTTAKVFTPNPVVQQMAQTQYVPQQVTRKVPVNVTRMQSEVQVREVPVQTVRMQQEEQIRTVPITVQKPVTERVERFIPEYRVRMVPQEYVRQVPVNTYKYVKEERVEQIPVRTCKMVREHHKIEVPRKQSRWVDEVTMRQVPRTIVMRVPIESESIFSSPPVEFNRRVVSDTPIADSIIDSTASDYGTIVEGPFTSSGFTEVNKLPIEDPIAEPTPAETEDEDDEDTVPAGNRPKIETSWRSVRRTAAKQPTSWRNPQKTATKLIRLSSN